MLSYKKWKKINENFGVNLGVKTHNKINTLHSKWDEAGMGVPTSKKSKKMFGGDDGPDMDSSDDADLHGDEGPSVGGGVMPPKKKKVKKPMPDDHDDDLDADMDGDDFKKGSHDEDDDSDHDEDGDAENDEDLGDEEGMDKSMPKPGMGKPGMGKFKKGPPMGEDPNAVKMMHKGSPTCSCKKCGKKCEKTKSEMCDKCKSKVKEEQGEFWRSLESQTGATKFMKDVDGAWIPVTEDAVIPPTDPNADIIDDAQPGDVGYAPQGRLGSNFTEWSQKYKRKKKK